MVVASQMTDALELNAWIEREFAGHGVAIRRETDPPILGEPLMSMVDAKELTRRAVAEFAAPARCDAGSVEAMRKARAYIEYALEAHGNDIAGNGLAALNALDRSLSWPGDAHLRMTLADYARDLRRNPSGGDDYPFDIMRSVADRIDTILALPSAHQRETYCALCDLEHQLHEDGQGFHHVIRGERVTCPVSSTMLDSGDQR